MSVGTMIRLVRGAGEPVKDIAVFQHGTATLYVMPDAQQCPKCRAMVRLVVNRDGQSTCVPCDPGEPAASGRPEEYAAWIEAYVARHTNRFVRGKCATATEEMVKAFPELRRVGGFVDVEWGRDQHWWCVAPDGSIVDPTVEQFGLWPVQYEELDLNDPATRARIPTGKCMDCGHEVYGGATFCNEACEAATRAYLGLSGGGR